MGATNVKMNTMMIDIMGVITRSAQKLFDLDGKEILKTKTGKSYSGLSFLQKKLRKKTRWEVTSLPIR